MSRGLPKKGRVLLLILVALGLSALGQGDWVFDLVEVVGDQ